MSCLRSLLSIEPIGGLLSVVTNDFLTPSEQQRLANVEPWTTIGSWATLAHMISQHAINEIVNAWLYDGGICDKWNGETIPHDSCIVANTLNCPVTRAPLSGPIYCASVPPDCGLIIRAMQPSVLSLDSEQPYAAGCGLIEVAWRFVVSLESPVFLVNWRELHNSVLDAMVAL